MTAQPESKLSRAIMAELRANGTFCFKIHGGPTMMAGLPDIIACVPVFRDLAVPHGRELGIQPATLGLFVGFETKMVGNVPSEIQLHRHAEIRASHGLVTVPHSVAEAMAFVDTVRNTYGT